MLLFRILVVTSERISDYLHFREEYCHLFCVIDPFPYRAVTSLCWQSNVNRGIIPRHVKVNVDGDTILLASKPKGTFVFVYCVS